MVLICCVPFCVSKSGQENIRLFKFPNVTNGSDLEKEELTNL